MNERKLNILLVDIMVIYGVTIILANLLWELDICLFIGGMMLFLFALYFKEIRNYTFNLLAENFKGTIGLGYLCLLFMLPFITFVISSLEMSKHFKGAN